MAFQNFHVVSLLLCYLAATTHGVTFSSLPNAIVVSASPKPGQFVKAGEDDITVSWSVNGTLPTGTDSGYRRVKVKLCYGPISQQDRPWRKTVDDLGKDKTCQHTIAEKPYAPSNNVGSWRVARDVPTATYFVRAYVYDSADEVVAYGQTTDAHKLTNLFYVQAISGRHVSLDIASVCFSAFSIMSLFGFFFLEKRREIKSNQ